MAGMPARFARFFRARDPPRHRQRLLGQAVAARELQVVDHVDSSSATADLSGTLPCRSSFLAGFGIAPPLTATAGQCPVSADRPTDKATCVPPPPWSAEHAAALLHPKLGAPLRAAVGGGKAIIPSAKKLGGPGTAIDVPLHFKDAAFVRTHYDAMEVRLPDAPRSDEIVLAIVVTDGGRPHPRIGGLTKDEARKDDGLR